MKFLTEKYGIGLNLLAEEDLEWLRHLRMNPVIQGRLLTKADITPEQQIEWFNSKNPNDFYFTVWDLERSKRIGFSSIKRLQEEPNVGHCGSFFDPEFHQSDLAMRFYFSQGDFIFESGLFNKLECSVLKKNKNALNTNFHIGYQIFKDNEDYVLLRLDKRDYLEIDSTVKRYLRNKYVNAWTKN